MTIQIIQCKLCVVRCPKKCFRCQASRKYPGIGVMFRNTFRTRWRRKQISTNTHYNLQFDKYTSKNKGAALFRKTNHATYLAIWRLPRIRQVHIVDHLLRIRLLLHAGSWRPDCLFCLMRTRARVLVMRKGGTSGGVSRSCPLIFYTSTPWSAA